MRTPIGVLFAFFEDMKWLTKLLISTLAVLATVWLLEPNVLIYGGLTTGAGLKTALIVALVLGLLNSILRPILIFLTLPATILSLGLFILVINAGMVLLADYFIDGFSVAQGAATALKLWYAFLFSVCMWAVQGLLGKLDNKKKRIAKSVTQSIN